MKPLGWKIVVVTDVGVDSGQRLRVHPADADSWLAAIGATASVPSKSGGPALPMALASPAAFAPAEVAAWLTAQGATADAAAIDAVLHHPAFQRVESAWRGMKLLLAHAGDKVEVWVTSMPRKGLAARFKEVVFLPEYHEAEPPSLLLLDFDFGYKSDELATLQELGAMAKVLQAPVVAHASAAFFDFRFLVQITTLGELLPRLMDNAHTSWKTFQTSDPARWLTLTINRWLQRAPYTSDAGHSERCAESDPDSYLWGRSSWMAGAAVARSAATYGHGLAIGGAQGGRFEGLATRPYPGKSNVMAPLSVEAPFAEMQVMELMRAGFAPVVAPMGADYAMLASAMSVFRLKPATPTLEGTLAYQLLAGRLAQCCARMLDEMPAGDPAAATAFIREQLLVFLGTLAGDAPEQAVQVELREEEIEGRKVPFAAIKVAPKVVLEGKPAEFEFMLPLEK